ncbi:MAG: hypothetical protein EoVTN8_1581 [Fluviibacter phosphoraccumulans EoVTN8]
MNLCAKATRLFFLTIGLLGCSQIFAQTASETTGPVLGLAMGSTLSFAPNFLSIDSNTYGNWSVQGVGSGLSFRQTNAVSSNEADYAGFSNAQMIVQKTNGPVQLLV